MTFREVLGVAEFRWMWLAQIQSMVGDQVARVALAILIYERTGSPATTSVVFALSLLPSLIGGLLLSGLADRFSRRKLMIGCDLARCGLIGAMALPFIPIWVVFSLLILAVLAGSPFTAAQAALTPTITGEANYLVATSIQRTSDQIAYLAGAGLGGLMVAISGSGGALLLDAVTFAVSAAFIAAGISERGRPVPTADRNVATRQDQAVAPTTRAGMRGAIALIATNRQLRILLGLACIMGFYVVPEALAAPLGRQFHGIDILVGIILAAPAAGLVVGNIFLARYVRPEARAHLIGPLAVAAGIPLALCAFVTSSLQLVALIAISGVLQCYAMATTATFSIQVPDHQRGSAIGLASSLLLTSQGVAPLIGGVLAEVTSAKVSVAVCACVGALLALILTARWTSAAAPERLP